MDEVLDPHQFGVSLAERVVDTYGLEIANEQVDDAVAFVTPAILERVRVMWLQGTPTLVAVDWGHECVDALLDRVLQHPGYLLMGAALVAFEPAAAMRMLARPQRVEPRSHHRSPCALCALSDAGGGPN
jgi:hypothetical protein